MSLFKKICFAWLKKNSTKKYDVIFLDPPTFSNSKRMNDVLDIQRDHVKLIELTMQLLSKSGVLFFSNNYRRFKIDRHIIDIFDCKSINDKCLSRDFKRNKNIHHCFKIQHR